MINVKVNKVIQILLYISLVWIAFYNNILSAQENQNTSATTVSDTPLETTLSLRTTEALITAISLLEPVYQTNENPLPDVSDYEQITFKPVSSRIGARLVEPTPLTQGSWFVAPNGQGIVCTKEHPCALHIAFHKAKAGDVVFLRGGVYYIEQRLSFPGGTSGSPITYESYPGEWAILDGSRLPYERSSYIDIHRNYTVMRRIEIRYMPAAGLQIQGSYNRIEGCHIHHNKLSGIQIYSPYDDFPYGNRGSYNQISDCIIHNNSDEGLTDWPFNNGNNADGISISSGEGNRITNCTVYANSDDGIDAWRSTNSYVAYSIAYGHGLGKEGNGNGFKAGSFESQSEGAVFEYCLSFNNRSVGFDFNGGRNVRFAYNTSYNNQKKGFYFGANAKVEHNLSVGERAAVGEGGFHLENNSWQKAIQPRNKDVFQSLDPQTDELLKPTTASGWTSYGAYVEPEQEQ